MLKVGVTPAALCSALIGWCLNGMQALLLQEKIVWVYLNSLLFYNKYNKLYSPNNTGKQVGSAMIPGGKLSFLSSCFKVMSTLKQKLDRKFIYTTYKYIFYLISFL